MGTRILLGLVLLGLSGVSPAALFDRGGGMIYDDVLNITWLQDANLAAGSVFDDGSSSSDGLMTVSNVNAWVNDLAYGGFTDWRLPLVSVAAGVGGATDNPVNCSTASEMDCRDNELGYMFYHNLMGTFGGDLTGDQGLFTNIQPGPYLSGTVSALDPTFRTWVLTFNFGDQAPLTNLFERRAWAVRDGDVGVVPLPAGIWLLGSGLLGLAGLRRR